MNPYRPVTNLTPEQQLAIDSIRSSFTTLAANLDDWLRPGRETSLALTNLEQASMWAVKAITHGGGPKAD